MGEYKFTKSLKKNLCKKLNFYFSNKNLDLIAKEEFKIESKKFPNAHIDIAILRNDFENNFDLSNILGIEIEVFSNQFQIIRNYNKFRAFIFQKNKGNGKFSGGLFHLIFDYANVSERKIIDLIKYSTKDSEKEYFFYNMYLHDINDLRASKRLAYELLEDWKFKTKFTALLELVFS
jgi:hypothetical protein